MKKSQILAALALAFALGVVAPVASTYAAYTTDYTEEQRTEMNNATAYAATLASSTRNLSDYITIYDTIETAKTGVRAELNKVVADALKQFKDGPAKANSDINTKIQAASLYSAAFDAQNLQDATKEQATPVSLPTIKDTNSLKAAYDSLKDLITKVEYNADLLAKNYKADAPEVVALQEKYTAVKDEAWGRINDIENEIAKFTTSANLLDTEFAAIDNEGFEKLQASEAWTDSADNTKTRKAIRWGLLINFAENLPKYNLVAPVITAKANFDRVISANEVVDFAHAQSFTNAYVNAVMAFRNGTTPNNPDEPGTTNPGTNQPGTNEPGSEDPSAPGTGLVSTAEGNAATTVSIVAGLATALTALGAGVVAYRSARRSNK